MTTQHSTSRLAIDAKELVKVFGDHRAVDGVNLAVPAGSIYAVLGPNGAGKTTTINMLATLLKPDGGTAKIFGHDIKDEAHVVRQLIGLTGQYASVDEMLSATQNLVIFSRLLGLSAQDAKKRAADLLEEFGLTDAANRPIKQFSGGMRRRLDLAISLIAQPPLIFLDEPTTGLDPHTRTQMWGTIRRLVATGSTVLLTTQYLEEADQLADRVAVIEHGKVIAEGTPRELKASIGSATLHLSLAQPHDTDKTAQFITSVLGVEVTTKRPGYVAAPMSNPDRVTDLLIVLRENNIHLTQVSVQEPTLDEVFLALTGTAKKTLKGTSHA